MNNRGQFTIIAALLVAIILAGTLIAVYATIRYDSSQSQTPQTLTATDETNSALLKALGFTVGYYGSILQVTGNQTYANATATTYMNNTLQYIASMNPSLGESISITSLTLSNNWFSNPSISTGKLSVVYNLADLGIYGVNYTTSCSLGVQIFNSPSSNQVCVNVTQDLTEPLTSLGQQNFAFYFYNYSTSNWQLINPSLTPTIFTNGTYLINVPPSVIDSSAYMVQVTDSRGITVEASSLNSYNINFTFLAQSSPAPAVVELLQNGTMLWSGQGIVNTTSLQPIPPVPVKSLHLCQTGLTSDIPFQVEDWASGYQIPLGLSSNYTIFSNSQMVVFEVSPSMSQLTLWWNGSDTAIQPSAAYTDTYFTVGNSAIPSLSNGNMTLQFSYPVDSANNQIFQVTSNVSGVISNTNFMRINRDNSTYGSGEPAYVIQQGVVRDIVQEEGEWGGGVTNCSNVYSQIVLTFPANATYFTYQLRLIFVNSTVVRNISDISLIRLTTSVNQPQAMTENGTANGIPNVTLGAGIFNNSTGNAHDWSQLINNVTLQGTGIMFTDSENQQLYAFDKLAGNSTGAFNVTSSIIELDPITSAAPVYNFTSALDLTWYGSVVTFNGTNPIYTSNGNSDLWPLVEQPPTVAITPQSSAATSINLSPSSGPANTSVTVSGGGFIPNSQITITFNGNTVNTTTANAYGEIPLGTTFNIATSTPGFYTITATDTSSNSASAIFTLPPMETVTFQISGIGSDAGASTILTIDSVNYTYSTLPASFIWPAESTHKITANTVAAGNGKQYAWASWNDSGAQTHPYTVPTSNDTITASYTTQYQLTTVTNFGTTTPVAGSTWYNAGSTVSISVTAPIAGSGEQYVWNGWTGTGSGSYTGTNNPATNAVTVNAAITETASWTHQYQVTVTASPSGAIGGTFAVTYTMSGTPHTNEQYNAPWTQWTDASTTVTVSSPQSSYNGYTFSSYTNNPVTMNSAQTITLVYYGALSNFVFSAISSPQTKGSAFSITITAQDQNGNTVKNYGSSVGLSASTGSGTISPTSTGTSSWSSGIWTGSVTLTTTGSVTITANDGSGHTGTSSAFTVKAPPPTLDVSNTSYTAGATSYAVSLTTTKANDILYVAVSTGSGQTASISGGGLTWTQRASVAINSRRTLQTFWALKTTAGAITITVTLGGNSASSVVACAISGANTTSPFDVTTPSANTGTTVTASTTISTTNPDFIIGAVGVRNNPISLTTGTGFTPMGSVTSVDPEVGAEYTTVTTAQTNLGVSYTLGSSNNWAIIADAIKGA